MKPVSKRRQDERGYAVLMVFLLAAGIAITLYMEMPRVAFESQRGKEQLLVDRGDQYKRAIQVFFRKNKRFPASLDELESFQNIRSLRHRYKDPMNGKEEWRLIHVGPNGMLMDSLVQKQQNPLSNTAGNNQTAGSTGPGGIQNTGSTNPGFDASQPTQAGANGQPGANGQLPQPPVNANGVTVGMGGINLALARRPSDKTPSGGQGGPAQPVDPNAPNYPLDPNAGAPQPLAGDPTQNPPGTQPPSPSLVGFQPIPGQPAQPQYGQQGQNGQPAQSQFGQNGQPPNGMPPGVIFNPGQPNTGANPSQNSNAAMNAIQQQILSPRQPPAGVGSSFGTQTTGGIAGVASTYKGGSIKIINERHKYQEWEFVYDMKKDKTIMGNAAAGAQQTPTVNPGMSNSGSGFGGTGGSTGFGGSGSGSGSGFGSSGGNSTGFGSSTATPTQPPTTNR